MNVSFPRSAGFRLWLPIAAVFCWILAAQLWLVARAGTDVPFMDQWDVEGAWLYPRVLRGEMALADYVGPYNEHRIAFTHLLNQALFRAAGRWDPLLQLSVLAGLHAALAAGLAAMLGSQQSPARRALIIGLVAIFCLPIPGWHNALWGFQSQIYLVILYSLGAVAAVNASRASWPWRMAGLLAAAASLFAMGAGFATPIVLLGLVLLPTRDADRIPLGWRLVPVLFLVALALVTRVSPPPELAAGYASSPTVLLATATRLLAWPWSQFPGLFLILNLPLVFLLSARLAKREWATGPASTAILGVGSWAVIVALAQAWSRGGGDELAAGIPSRYVDFYVLLPLANTAALLLGMRSENPVGRFVRGARWAMGAWTALLVVGWVLSAQSAWIHVVAPRMADRAIPERLMAEFSTTRDPAVFAGRPRLLTPHPSLSNVVRVLDDPVMRGHLPPTIEPAIPLAPISRFARSLLAWSGVGLVLSGLLLTAVLIESAIRRPTSD